MPVEVRDLSHVYNEDSPFSAAALKGVSLTIADGEFLAVIGHTGSGKSTLIQMLNGLLRPTSGQVLLNGKAVGHGVGSSKKRAEQAAAAQAIVRLFPEQK